MVPTYCDSKTSEGVHNAAGLEEYLELRKRFKCFHKWLQ